MTKEQMKKEFLVSIGLVIRKKRERKNITQQELGNYLKVTKSTISRYENGEMDMPLSNLPLISSYCGFTLNDYVYDEKVQLSARYFMMLQENVADIKKQPQSVETVEHSEQYNKLLAEITKHLAEEGSDKTVNVLYYAGRFIEHIQKDNAELARELSKQTLTHVYSIDEYIQKHSRVGRGAGGM